MYLDLRDLNLNKYDSKIEYNSKNSIKMESKKIDLEGAINFIEEKINELTQENETLNLPSNEEADEPNRNNDLDYYIESIKEKYENVLDCLNGLKYLVKRKY